MHVRRLLASWSYNSIEIIPECRKSLLISGKMRLNLQHICDLLDIIISVLIVMKFDFNLYLYFIHDSRDSVLAQACLLAYHRGLTLPTGAASDRFNREPDRKMQFMIICDILSHAGIRSRSDRSCMIFQVAFVDPADPEQRRGAACSGSNSNRVSDAGEADACT